MNVISRSIDGAECAHNEESSLQPQPPPFRGFTVHSVCGTCAKLRPAEMMVVHDGANLCDFCAEDLKPNRYQAELFMITKCADDECWHGLALSLADAVLSDKLVLIEDEYGDLVYSSLNTGILFAEPAVPGETASYYLPEEMRPAHRRTQRESLQALQQRCYVATVGKQHWTTAFYPFECVGERFTLALLQNLSTAS
jgi:hypothetical protein